MIQVTALASATISAGMVTAIAITEPGSNYNTNALDPVAVPTCTITGGGGTGATCSAFIAVAGTVGSILVTNPGSGYTSEPVVFLAIASRYGFGAAADALLTGVDW